MLVKKEMSVYNFAFWSGGKDTVEELTFAEILTIWDYLEETNGEMDETEINDFFWFERDYIAELLGFENFDEIMQRNKNNKKKV